MDIPQAYNALFTAAERLGRQVPKFEVLERSGPPHAETWKVSVKFEGVVYPAQGRSEKDSKQNAAMKVLNDEANAAVRQCAVIIRNNTP